MSRFVQGFHSASDAQNKQGPVWAAMSHEFPELAVAFFGVEGKEGRDPVWPCTLMLFMEGDKLKFCLNPKSGSRVCFGVCDDPCDPVGSVEQALLSGRFEWKPRGKRNWH